MWRGFSLAKLTEAKIPFIVLLANEKLMNAAKQESKWQSETIKRWEITLKKGRVKLELPVPGPLRSLYKPALQQKMRLISAPKSSPYKIKFRDVGAACPENPSLTFQHPYRLQIEEISGSDFYTIEDLMNIKLKETTLEGIQKIKMMRVLIKVFNNMLLFSGNQLDTFVGEFKVVTNFKKKKTAY